jgi:hypothetical protein
MSLRVTEVNAEKKFGIFAVLLAKIVHQGVDQGLVPERVSGGDYGV